MPLRRHGRFLIALLAGAIAAALAPVTPGIRVLIGADTYCLAYLILMLHFASVVTADGLRANTGDQDEGVPVIVLVAIAVVAVSLGAVFLTLNAQTAAAPVEAALALSSIPLCWAMLQTLIAFHYARLYYGRIKGTGIAKGLRFEGRDDPGPVEFLYYAFTVGMTAQVSDTVATTTAMRKITLLHAVLSFFYNTVILALAVNAAVALGR
jgi:uncharacterized membrane protein